MTGHVHLPRGRIASPDLASALAPLCRLPQAGTRLRLVATTVAPVALEASVLAALVLFHHLPALLVAAGIKDTIHD
jgi:hypothetical protein